MYKSAMYSDYNGELIATALSNLSEQTVRKKMYTDSNFYFHLTSGTVKLSIIISNE